MEKKVVHSQYVLCGEVERWIEPLAHWCGLSIVLKEVERHERGRQSVKERRLQLSVHNAKLKNVFVCRDIQC